ncbi:hypothetical protein [Natronorubrum sp. FCH18a]|uniref:hypothetical protein n=1 Tax=Natronorubrum sp. FCH18a TaxID=3447018 RepID=UPI003F5157B7
MPSLQDLRDDLTDESLRVAILAGLATIPFTVLLAWAPVSGDVVPAGSLLGNPLMLAGLLVGYCYSDRPTESRRAGMWTGLAGSLGVVAVAVVDAVTSIPSAPPEFFVLTVVATPVLLAIGVGFLVLFTTLSAQFADWVTTRLTRDRRLSNRSGTDEHVTASRWWLPVAVYAALAPVALGYALGVMPESGVGILLSVLGLLALVVFAVAALAGLFIDATAPRDEDSAWFPNALLYAGVPLGAYALAHLAATLWTLENPPGYGMYAFLGALWLTSAVYLTRRRRYVVTFPIRST